MSQRSTPAPRSSHAPPSVQSQGIEEEHIEYTFDESAEAGMTKLWGVYVKEAATYDKSLVESWKSDMEGMLIFAGLFSASLTAFIIESYKTLVADPADTSVVLLKQISLQLANQTTTLNTEDPSFFTPSTSALICNILWFLSLGLSLACALVATLLQQWTREFLHQADARSSPNTRAHMYSFLYYGMRDFKMHAVADAIPSLLHASLLLFFAGLVAFLLPVNKIIAVLVSGVLLLVLGVYLLLTILPLLRINSPYRTPLSNMLWSIVRWVGLRLAKFNAPAKSLLAQDKSTAAGWRDKLASILKHPALVDRIRPAAVHHSPERDTRDSRALKWTVRSLSDDLELEAFLEAIPDAVWGTSARHELGTKYLRELRDADDLDLVGRITSLLYGSASELLLSDELYRRQTICYKAIWAVASIPEPSKTDWYLHPFSDTPNMVSPFKVSAYAMTQWATARSVMSQLQQCGVNLAQICEAPDGPLNTILNGLRLPHIPWAYAEVESSFPRLKDAAQTRQVTQFHIMTKTFNQTVSILTALNYLGEVVTMNLEPYRWEETLRVLMPYNTDPLTNVIIDTVESVFAMEQTARAGSPLQDKDGCPYILDRISDLLCSLWRPDKPRCIPWELVEHLRRSNVDTLQSLLSGSTLGSHIWACLGPTFEVIAGPTGPSLFTADQLAEMIAITSQFSFVGPSEEQYNVILVFLRRATGTPATKTASALLHARILRPGWGEPLPPANIMQKFVYPATNDTAASRSGLDGTLLLLEANLDALISVLEACCTSDSQPYRMVESVEYLARIQPGSGVRPSVQLQFASALYQVVEKYNSETDTVWRQLLMALLSSRIMSAYEDGPYLWWGHHWIDDDFAVEKLRAALRKDFITGQDAEKVHQRAKGILSKLDSYVEPTEAPQGPHPTLQD